MKKKPQWILVHAEGQARTYSTDDPYTDTAWSHPAAIGRGCTLSNGAEVSEHYCYNGSGTGAFSGIDKWPAVSLRVDLPEGRLDLRTDLADLLKKVVRDFLIKHCE